MPKPKWLEPLEQTAHFWMGFGARLVYMDALLWRREAVKQWPPATDREPILDMRPTARKDVFEGYVRQWGQGYSRPYCSLARAEDTMMDLFWMVIGATCAEIVRWPVIAYLIVRYT